MDNNKQTSSGTGLMFALILIMLIFSFIGIILYLYNMFEFIREMGDFLTLRSIATYIEDLIFHISVIVLLFFALSKA